MKYFSKLTFVIVALLSLCLGLTACAGEDLTSGTTYFDISTGKIEDTQSENLTSGALTTPEADSASTEAAEEKYILLNEFGDYVELKEADEISISGKATSPDEALENEVGYLACYNDYTYMTKSNGISCNSVTDLFDEDKNIFNKEIPAHEYDYFKACVGDTFGELTVSKAFTSYNGKGYNTLFPHDSSVAFSGSLTLTGYITAGGIVEGGLEFYKKGEILFFVDAESWGNIPIIIGEFSKLPNSCFNFDVFKYGSDIGVFNLGEIEEYNEIDISAIPQDGTFAKVKITISDIELRRFYTGSGGYNYAKIEVASAFID